MGKYILVVDGVKQSEQRGIELAAGSNITLTVVETEGDHVIPQVTIASTASGGDVATDTIWDAAGDLAQGTGADTAAVLARGTSLTDRLVTNGTSLAWQPALVPALADDGPITADTTLTDDAELKWTVAANETWFVQAWVYMTADNTTMDVKFGWSVPTDTTMRWGGVTFSGGTGAGGWYTLAPGSTQLAVGTEATVGTYGSPSATTAGYLMSGTVYVAGTGGTVALQWAQNTSDAGALTREDGSCLLLWRLA